MNRKSPVRVRTPIGEAYQVSAEYFLDHVLPPLHPKIDIDKLTKSRAFRKAVTTNGTLWGYSEKDPSRFHREDVKQAYRYLQQDIHMVVQAAQSQSKNKPFVFRNNKQCVSYFGQRTNGCMPDAYFLREWMPSMPIQWSDVAAFAEYKSENTTDDVQENIKKIAASMFECMRKDPGRRFIYAFSAEDASMKLWYCDRSQVIVSEPFNFIQDYRTLTRFALGVSFAEPHQVGWDPTMMRIFADDQVQYDITVHSADDRPIVYRTLRVLSDSGPIRGVLCRGTRVWEATQVVNGVATGEPVALKDSWVDIDREREGTTYARLFQSDFFKTHSEFGAFFITVVTHGDVSVADAQDHTPDLHLSSNLSYEREKTPLARGSVMSDHTFEMVQEAWAAEAAGATTTYPSVQAHYRVVYQEVGEPLAEVTSLCTVFKVLKDVTQGLMAMHASGWVHRDISAGNVLIVNGVGKITDMEYATSEAQQSSLGRTGTAFFVAVEVEFGSYLFLPPPEAHPEDLMQPEDFDFDILAMGPDVYSQHSHSSRSSRTLELDLSPPWIFRYNTLHDLESLWWLAVYFIADREVDDGKDDTVPRATIFREGTHRQSIIKRPGYFLHSLGDLHPSLSQVVQTLDDLRAALVRAYVDAEASIDSISFGVAKPVYDQFLAGLTRAMEVTEDVRIRRRLR